MVQSEKGLLLPLLLLLRPSPVLVTRVLLLLPDSVSGYRDYSNFPPLHFLWFIIISICPSNFDLSSECTLKFNLHQLTPKSLENAHFTSIPLHLQHQNDIKGTRSASVSQLYGRVWNQMIDLNRDQLRVGWPSVSKFGQEEMHVGNCSYISFQPRSLVMTRIRIWESGGDFPNFRGLHMKEIKLHEPIFEKLKLYAHRIRSLNYILGPHPLTFGPNYLNKYHPAHFGLQPRNPLFREEPRRPVLNDYTNLSINSIE